MNEYSGEEISSSEWDAAEQKDLEEEFGIRPSTATELLKQMEKNGITGRWLSVSDSALKAIISSYTREAGVRELERKIGDICRKAAKEILYGI